ncbi:hypothetical protein D3C85_1534100 [compost metagenome]
MTSTTLARNGRRQPHSRKLLSGNCVTRANDADDSTRPNGTPASGNAPRMPFHLGGACSTAINIAPPNSPPNATPCIMRNNTSRTGAQAPIAA